MLYVYKNAMRLANITAQILKSPLHKWLYFTYLPPQIFKVLYIVTVFNIYARALTFEKFRQDVAGRYCEIRSHCQGGKRKKAINALSQLEKKLGLEISHTCSGPSRHLSGRSWQK